MGAPPQLERGASFRCRTVVTDTKGATRHRPGSLRIALVALSLLAIQCSSCHQATMVPGPVEGFDRIDVLVIGDVVPDDSFFGYDPALRYLPITYPSFAESAWEPDQVDEWLNVGRARGSFRPADFVIELPYLKYGQPEIENRLRRSVEESVKYRGASILLPVPQTTLLAQFAPDETRIDIPPAAELITEEEVNEAGPRRLETQNRDVLGGNLNNQFSISFHEPLSQFEIASHYHDANLFLMEAPHRAAEVVATVEPTGTLSQNLAADTPWMVRLPLSAMPSGADLSATGSVWKCASPLTGVFFFPENGWIATQTLAGGNYVHVDNLKTGEDHRYAWDLVSHIILLSAGREPPDPVLAHQARELFSEYHTAYSTIYRALAFAEMVASKTQTYPVWVELARMGKHREMAANAYLAGGMEKSIWLMERVLKRGRIAQDRAQQELQTSLFTVHVVEWATVGFTLLISLSATLHIMNKPNPRPVGSTHFAPLDHGERRSTEHKAAERPTRPECRNTPHRRAITAIALVIVAAPIVVLLWEPVSEMASWTSISRDTKPYNLIDEEERVYEGRLATRTEPRVHIDIDAGSGAAWISQNGGVDDRYWPFELVIEGKPALPVTFEEENDLAQARLAKYIGRDVEIRGKIRTVTTTHGGYRYTVTGARELVPGAVREAKE